MCPCKARFAPADTPADDLYPGDVLVRPDGPHLACCPDGSLCRLRGAATVHPDDTISVGGVLMASPCRPVWTLLAGVWAELRGPR